MPINETSGKPKRERWPIEFDLAGIPRPRDVTRFDFGTDEEGNAIVPRDRNLELARQREREAMQNKPANTFYSDGKTLDMSRPILVHTPFQEFPKLLHKGSQKKQVNNADEQATAVAAGWGLKPNLEARVKAAKRQKQEEIRRKKHIHAHSSVGAEPPDFEGEEEDEDVDDDLPIAEAEEVNESEAAAEADAEPEAEKPAAPARKSKAARRRA